MPDHYPQHEPSVFGVSPAPALTPAPHRTSLAEGKQGGRVDRNGDGEATPAVSKAFEVQAWGQERVFVCVCVCARVQECACVRVSSPRPTILCVCMHVFVKKKKKWKKNLNNKCFICFNVLWEHLLD